MTSRSIRIGISASALLACVVAASASEAASVGVIPAIDECPTGTQKLVIRMDDEDLSNGNWTSGWIGATESAKSGKGWTKFTFCKVDAAQFKPLKGDDRDTAYAVLKLSEQCPPSTYEFWRYFDNQDSGTFTRNGNWSEGIIYPNTCTENTRLYFCLFLSDFAGVGTADRLPDVGFSYGVFASDHFVYGSSYGTVRTDDEDWGNNNSLFLPSESLRRYVREIVHEDGTKGATQLHIAKVR